MEVTSRDRGQGAAMGNEAMTNDPMWLRENPTTHACELRQRMANALYGAQRTFESVSAMNKVLSTQASGEAQELARRLLSTLGTCQEQVK